MAKNRGRTRRERKSSGSRNEKLANYFIVTDAEKTEKNYIEGLKKSLPIDKQERITIKIRTGIKSYKIVEYCEKEMNANPVYSETWIVIDRDEVTGFDEIVRRAEKRGIKVAWSNPCIETWFSAYLGNIVTDSKSKNCIKSFEKIHKKHIGCKYEKKDEKIYEKLIKYGDEEKAIERAERMYTKFKEDNKKLPTEMYPCTMLHKLVYDIKRRANE